MRLRYALAILASSIVLGTAAEEARANEPATAQALYEEGMKLLVAGRTADACARFVESRKLEEGIGVTLYLGDCYDRLGRTASAFTTYAAAAALARARNDARADVAEKRREKLAPRLRRIVVRPSEVGTTVSVDGEPVGDDPLALDPGLHVVEAKAEGRLPWQSRFEAPAEGATVKITVPPLGRVPSAPPPKPGPPAVAVVAGAVGLAGIAVGSVFGALALSKKADSNDAGCTSDDRCPPPAAALREDARDLATVSTVGFVAGVAFVVTGAVLLFTAPTRKPSAAAEAVLRF